MWILVKCPSSDLVLKYDNIEVLFPPLWENPFT